MKNISFVILALVSWFCFCVNLGLAFNLGGNCWLYAGVMLVLVVLNIAAKVMFDRLDRELDNNDKLIQTILDENRKCCEIIP